MNLWINAYVILILIILKLYYIYILLGLQEIRQLDHMIIKLRQRLYQASKKNKCAWNSTARSRLVAVSIYVQSNYSDETVMQYLLRKRCKRWFGYDEKAEDDCRCSPIRDWFLNVPINVLEEIALHPLSKQTALIYREAQQFVTEMQTCVWLEKENIEKGRAVSSLELVQQYFHQLKRNEDKYYEEDVLTVGEDFPVENKAGEKRHQGCEYHAEVVQQI